MGISSAVLLAVALGRFVCSSSRRPPLSASFVSSVAGLVHFRSVLGPGFALGLSACLGGPCCACHFNKVVDMRSFLRREVW